MIMPGPVWREHEIAGFHQHLLAFDVGVAGAVGFDDETQRRCGMAMTLGALAGFHQLDRHLDRSGSGFSLSQCRINELHCATLGRIVNAAQLDDLARLH
jgi:hypothetical protein